VFSMWKQYCECGGVLHVEVEHHKTLRLMVSKDGYLTGKSKTKQSIIEDMLWMCQSCQETYLVEKDDLGRLVCGARFDP